MSNRTSKNSKNEVCRTDNHFSYLGLLLAEQNREGHRSMYHFCYKIYYVHFGSVCELEHNQKVSGESCTKKYE